MSDEAKAEAIETEPLAPEAEAKAPPAGEAELITARVLQLARKVLPAAWAIAVVVAAAVSGIELAFLTAAGGVVVLVVVLMWTSVQSLTGSASLGFEEALGMGAPSKVEEQKRAVLRALKDLEFERSVGKISTDDYNELSAKYRTEAKRLMQTLDESQGAARAQVEAILARRLRREGLAEADHKATAEAEHKATAESAAVEATSEPKPAREKEEDAP